MFKEIKANFDLVGSYEGSVYHYRIEVIRKESGASKYGDHSCHLLNLYENDKFVSDNLYDTRYDHIPTQKDAWVKEWTDYIRDEWVNVKSVELLDYEEKEVEERKRN